MGLLFLIKPAGMNVYVKKKRTADLRKQWL